MPKIEYEDSDNVVNIEMPASHWVIVLAAVDQLVAAANETLDDLKQAGKTEEDLSEEEITALAGPFIARATIVDKLTEIGVMTQNAKRSMGMSRLDEMIERYLSEKH